MGKARVGMAPRWGTSPCLEEPVLEVLGSPPSQTVTCGRLRARGRRRRSTTRRSRSTPTGRSANQLGASSPRCATLGGILAPRTSTTCGAARTLSDGSCSPSPSRYSGATLICSLEPTLAADATNQTTPSPCDSTRAGTLAIALVPTQTRAVGGTHRIIILISM